MVPDPKAIADFYARVLGFKVSDWIGDFFVFLRCNADHHSVNFISGKTVGDAHHIAYEMRDFSHQKRLRTLFEGREMIPIIWGDRCGSVPATMSRPSIAIRTNGWWSSTPSSTR